MTHQWRRKANLHKWISRPTGFSKSRTKLKEQEQYQQAFLKAVLNSKRMKVQQTQLITIRNNLLTGDKGAIDCCTDEYGRSLGDSNEMKPYYFYRSRAYFSKECYGPRATGHAEGSIDRGPWKNGHCEGRMGRANLRRGVPCQDLPDLMVVPLVLVECAQ